MREIRFHGKDIKGNWYYGLLCKPTVGKYAGMTFISNGGGMPMAFDVRPETVGQYTGLKDKNGREIYEGDVYEQIWEGETIRGEIEYGGMARFWIKATANYLIGEIKSATGQVIGNVWENPELKEVE